MLIHTASSTLRPNTTFINETPVLGTTTSRNPAESPNRAHPSGRMLIPRRQLEMTPNRSHLPSRPSPRSARSARRRHRWPRRTLAAARPTTRSRQDSRAQDCLDPETLFQDPVAFQTETSQSSHRWTGSSTRSARLSRPRRGRRPPTNHHGGPERPTPRETVGPNRRTTPTLGAPPSGACAGGRAASRNSTTFRVLAWGLVAPPVPLRAAAAGLPIRLPGS